MFKEQLVYIYSKGTINIIGGISRNPFYRITRQILNGAL